MSEPRYTGLKCPECRKPVAVVEYETPNGLTFFCPAYGHRWSADAPGAPKH